MNDIPAPSLEWAGILLACVFTYGAWQEVKAENPRDARLLAATGAISLAGAGVALYF